MAGPQALQSKQHLGFALGYVLGRRALSLIFRSAEGLTCCRFAPPTTGRDRVRRHFIGGFWFRWRPPQWEPPPCPFGKDPRLASSGGPNPCPRPILVQLQITSSREGLGPQSLSSCWPPLVKRKGLGWGAQSLSSWRWSQA